MTIPLDYERLGGPRTLPPAERRRATATHIGKLSRARYEAAWLAARAEAEGLRTERDELAGRVVGWRDNFLAAARDAHRFYLAALVGWGLALLCVVAFVVRLATGG